MAMMLRHEIRRLAKGNRIETQAHFVSSAIADMSCPKCSGMDSACSMPRAFSCSVMSLSR